MSIFHHTISRVYRIIKSNVWLCSLLVPTLELESRDIYISFFGKVKEGKWKTVDCYVMARKTDEQRVHAKLEETMHKCISADEAIGISVTVLPEDVKSN